MLTVVDATDKATSYAYRSGDVVAAIDSDANTVNQFVDAAGRVRIARDEAGNETRTDFDNLNLLTRHIDPLGGLTEFTYDPNGNLSSLEDPRAHTTTYTYDPMDRVATRVDPLVQAESFTHDANGNLTSIEDRADQVTVFEYDALDRRTFAGFDSTGTPPTYESTVTFNDDAGRTLTSTLPNGIVGSYAYDAATRLASISYTLGQTTLGDLAYRYDPSGHRTTVDGSLARVTLPAALTAATYDAANRLTAWGSTALGSDPTGNLTSDGSRTFEWNTRGELSRIADAGSTTATFAYDAFGRRTGKTISGTATGFAYDGSNAIQEQAGGAPSANLLTGGVDELFRRSDAAGDRYPLTDALGSVIALTDASGAIANSYTYEPYGATTTTGAASVNPTGFTGREHDATGFYFYRARYYDPVRGRFLSEDPLGFAARDPNLYRYVGNDPIDLTDPSGEIAPIVVIGAGCAAGALAYGGITVLGNAYSNIFLGKRKDLFDGFDLVDAAISCGAGVIGGIVAGPGWAALQRVAIGAITGFESTLASQANHGDRDPSQLVLGTVGGGAAAPLPIPAAHEPAGRAFGGGFVLNVGVGMGQTIVQEGVEELINWLEQFLP